MSCNIFFLYLSLFLNLSALLLFQRLTLNFTNGNQHRREPQSREQGGNSSGFSTLAYTIM